MLCAALLLSLLPGDPIAGPGLAVERIVQGAAAQGTGEGHVFSGREVPLTLRVFGAQGEKLDLAVRPYQIAHALAAPAGPALDVAREVELGKSAWHDFTCHLDCPRVERWTVWELRFLARVQGEEAWSDVGCARLELYPPDLLAGLRSMAREEPWFVRDAQGRLKEFLNASSIAFLDLERPAGKDAWARSLKSSGTSRESLLMIWVQSGGADAQTEPPAALMEAPRALIFVETARAMLLVREAGRTCLTLRGELITRLLDDPRAQSAFVEAVELLFPSDS